MGIGSSKYLASLWSWLQWTACKSFTVLGNKFLYASRGEFIGEWFGLENNISSKRFLTKLRESYRWVLQPEWLPAVTRLDECFKGGKLVWASAAWSDTRNCCSRQLEMFTNDNYDGDEGRRDSISLCFPVGIEGKLERNQCWENGKTPCLAPGLCPLCLGRCPTQQQAVVVLRSTGGVNLVSSPKKQQTDKYLPPHDQ